MQSQSQTPLEALRGHSHVVVYAPRDGGLWTSIAPSIEAAGIHAEVIGHPLLCMAALCWREFNGRRPGSRESTAFVAVDLDDIDRLEPMFDSIRTKLPHVSVWVIGSNFTIRVIEGKPRVDASPHAEQRATTARFEVETKIETKVGPKIDTRFETRFDASFAAPATAPTNAPLRAPQRTPPKLRISRTGDADEATTERGSTPPPPSRQKDLDHIDSILRGDAAGREAAASAHDGDSSDDAEPIAPSATRLTSEELDMLMGDPVDDPTRRDHRGIDEPEGRAR